MGRIKFRVPPNERIYTEDRKVTKPQIVELDLSARNEVRFHLTPNQLSLYTAWKLSGGSISFDEWLNKQKWDDEAKKFIIS